MNGRAVEGFLSRHDPIGIDTSVFIYKVERNLKYLDRVNPIFEWLLGTGHAVTSTVTMVELLVQPFRARDRKRAEDCYALLTTYPHLEWIAPDLEIAATAARLRAEHNLSTPDAIQAATALENGAGGLLSNDAAFRRVRGIDVLILDDLV